MQDEQIEKLQKKMERQATLAFNRAARILRDKSRLLLKMSALEPDQDQSEYKDAVNTLSNIYSVAESVLFHAEQISLKNKMVDIILGEARALSRTWHQECRAARIEGIDKLIGKVAPEGKTYLTSGLNRSTTEVALAFRKASLDLLSMATNPNNTHLTEWCSVATEQAKTVLAWENRA